MSNTTYHITSHVITSTIHSTEYTFSTTESILSLFSSFELPLFWVFLVYSALILIIALLYFLFRTCPQLTKDTEPNKASLEDILREGANHSIFNVQQYIMDIIDLITDIMYSFNFYLFYYASYHILGICVFTATALLILLLSFKCILLKHNALIYPQIWNHLIMFDLLTASLCNAIQGAVTFYILYRDEIQWNIIIQIKVGVVGYLMTLKLFRIVCMKVKPSTKEYDSLKSAHHTVQQSMDGLQKNYNKLLLAKNDLSKQVQKQMNNADKVNSISVSQQYVEEEKAVEIELISKKNVENESISKKKDVENGAKEMLSDINNCAKFDETRQLLMDLSKNDDLSKRYEEEWSKNVLILVRDNEKKLRNQSMKPVVKQYVKTLEKEGGDDYKKFMSLLQKKSNGLQIE